MNSPINIAQLPDTQFYAILFPKSQEVPDEYEHDWEKNHKTCVLNYWNIQIYETKESWVKEIKRLSDPTKSQKVEFKAVVIDPAKIKINVEINVS